MNEHEAERIAAAINVLRPDWPVKSLMTLMARPQLANRPRRDVCVALAWVACETNTHTPARVVEDGPWWRAAAIDTTGTPAGRHPLKANEQCPHHPGQPVHNCGGCRADALADDKPGTPPPAWQPSDATTHADQIRARMGWTRTEGDAR